MVGQLAERVAGLLHRPVHVAFVDVVGPTPQEVLRALPADRPVTVVPAFLASGYHVRVDLPAHVAAGGHRAVTVTAPLGPCVSTVQVLSQRLVEMWLAARRRRAARRRGHIGCACAVRSPPHCRNAVGDDRRSRWNWPTPPPERPRSPMRWRHCGATVRRAGVIPLGGWFVSRSAARQRSRPYRRPARRPSCDDSAHRQPVQARADTAGRIVRRRRTCARPPRWSRSDVSTPARAGRPPGRRQDRNDP
jgi:hypothetical protein